MFSGSRGYNFSAFESAGLLSVTFTTVLVFSLTPATALSQKVFTLSGLGVSVIWLLLTIFFFPLTG